MTVDVRREAIAAIEEGFAQSSRALVVVEIDPDGDGVLLARSATIDRADQLTAQVWQLLRAADAAGRRPKVIVAAGGISGAKAVDERPDLVAVLEALHQDGCSWVGVWSVDRIGRSIATTERFIGLLRKRGAALYVGDADNSEFDDPNRLVELAYELVSSYDKVRMVERLKHARERRGSLRRGRP